MSPDGSVSRWVKELKAGNPAAAQQIWDRFFQRMVGLATAKLRVRPGGLADPEDAALSAFDSLCRGAVRGQFPQLSDRDNLWGLLVVITSRKVADLVNHERCQRRGGGKVVGESGLPGPGPDSSTTDGLDGLAGEEPTPEFVACMAEQYDRLMALLDDDQQRQIARMRLEGYEQEEIARDLGCAVRTVKRRMQIIRRTWEAEVRP